MPGLQATPGRAPLTALDCRFKLRKTFRGVMLLRWLSSVSFGVLSRGLFRFIPVLVVVCCLTDKVEAFDAGDAGRMRARSPSCSTSVRVS